MAQADLEEMGEEEMKQTLFRQYTQHNETVMDAQEAGVVRCKIVVVGAEGVGKTSMMNRLTKNQFTQAQAPTIGSAYFIQGVAIEDVEYNFDIWDVSGNDRYSTLVPMYLQFAEACIVVYDVTRPSTFIAAKQWVENVAQLGEKDMFIVLVGMKADLLEESKDKLTVPESQALEFANENDITAYPLCSAKNGQGVEDVLLDIAENVHERRMKNGMSSGSLEIYEEDKEDPYEFATRATTLTRAQRKDTMIDDFNERFTGCLSCLNRFFSDTVTKTTEISKKAAFETRKAFQSMSEKVDDSTKNYRKSLKHKIYKKQGERQASLIHVPHELEEREGETTPKKTDYKPTVTIAPLKG